MVPPAETNLQLLEKHKNLEISLNLDEETSSRAWKNFEAIRSKYSLEGDMVHWLGCAIFVACRTAVTPTVTQSSVQGNCVSLTSLLRYCGLSLPHFFNKIKDWVEMENLGKDFEGKIVNIQRSFEISGSTFREFQPMFMRIFQSPTETEITSHRNRKQKLTPCTPSKVFDFCWLLFITIKGACSDVVTAYNYLLVCCDLAFQNAFLDDRRDLLKPTFEGLPENWCLMDYTVPKTAPCVMSLLCSKEEILSEAIYMKEYTTKALIKSMFERGMLQGDSNTFSRLLHPENFERNFKSVTKAYEAYLLDRGDFDERIFLAEFKRQILLSSQQASMGPDGIFPDSGAFGGITPNLNITRQCPDTPLTGRRFLAPRDPSDGPGGAPLSALSAATQCVARLHALVGGHAAIMAAPPAPDAQLRLIFAGCTTNPEERIKDILTRRSATFTVMYASAMEDNIQNLQTEKRLQFAAALFYKLLSNMLQHEKSLRKDISPLVQNDIFYDCLYACCIEIVMFSYNSQHKFPWILNALQISSFYFVRVIELILRSKDQLPREVVKHLNYIEEAILSSIMWKSDSLIWAAIKRNEEIPKYEQIALPGHIVYNNDETAEKRTTINTASTRPIPKSPAPSAVETFQSPVPNQNPLNSPTASPFVKKQLFPPTKPGQSLLHTSTPNGSTTSDNNAEPPTRETTPNRPQKSGSLNIIFRKFYYLALVRMEHLCSKTGITDMDLKCKIWTVLEHSIRSHSDLIKDRHLDQLLMCAVYVICKVTKNFENIKFTDIIRCYREQPQATSDIYRKVLISRRNEMIDQNGALLIEDEVKQDLICFYNNVYVQDMQTFALKFSNQSSNQSNGNILLSPLPSVKSLMVSPRHQVAKNVYIKAYESPSNSLGDNKSSYVFNRSASKDLSNINKAINNGGARKRALEDFDGSPAVKKNSNGLIARVENLLNERKVQNA